MICDVWLSTIRLTLANTSSNGIPERAVKTFKEYLRKPSTLPMLIRVSKFLLTNRLTPHSVTEEAPSKLMLGKIIRSSLDLVQPNL